MKDKYAIFTYVSSDIEATFIKENDVHFIPMKYMINSEDKLYTGIYDENILKDFYLAQKNGAVTKTTQIAPQIYSDIWEPIVKEGISIIYISLSSGLSSTYQSAVLAANELMDKYPDIKIIPIDSLAGTGGMSLLVERAIENKKNGMTIEDNAACLDEIKHNICHWFMVEDLMYLRRGGRISATTAIVGTTLNIKPILKINDEGKLVPIAKKRGIKAALKELVNLYEMASEGGEERVYITHADCIDNAKKLEKAILEKNPKCKITILMLNPIIGAHTGPGMIAILHFGKKR
ncbi:DegV family protein [Clostridium bornimense]|uniref:DegV family protein n=1 Tax=Clostridium bornimense TaxID=1216932 RepID=UPI001C12505F|nr:DegV family protein [Clostridium bornimense]MBU5316242.1 DegV family protein [Clostridium bornimense]